MPGDEKRDDAKTPLQPESLDDRTPIVDPLRRDDSADDSVDTDDVARAPEQPFTPEVSDTSGTTESLPADNAAETGEPDSAPLVDSGTSAVTPPEDSSSTAFGPAEPVVDTRMKIELPPGVQVPNAQPPAALGDRRSFELPLGTDGVQEEESDPVDEIFPPEWRLPAHTIGSTSAAPASAADEDSGHVPPRVQVMVTLADARVLFDEALAEASERTAPQFKSLAKEEVDYAFWLRGNQQRANDYRLRGP